MRMMDLIAVIGGKRYNTATATLLAHNAFWDGSNFERGGTNSFLLRTKKGTYFWLYQT